jgi:hypothetical protein
MQLLTALTVLLFSSVISSLSTVTINTDAACTSLPPCAQNCLCCNGGYQNLLGDGLSCPGPFLHGCFFPTRTDLAPVVTRWLSSCITGACTQGEPGPDCTSAWNLYGTYCLTNGYSIPGFTGVAAAATATGGDSSAPTITQVTSSLGRLRLALRLSWSR